MKPLAIGKPDESEYAGHFGRYISLVNDPDIITVLENQLESTRALLAAIPETRATHRYEPGKWSIKELAGHIADSERVFAYRALRFGRNDHTELPGFDQDTFAEGANFANLPLSGILEEYEAVRRATLLLFKHFNSDAWRRVGIADGKALSVRAIGFTIAGHELHHISVLKNRYL